MRISLRSDPGDWVGGGRSYTYSFGTTPVRVSTRGAYLSISVQGNESWSGEFQLPGNAGELQPGSYAGLTRYPFQTAGAGALSWSGQGRACNAIAGSIEVRSVRYAAGRLQAIDMSFEQRCEGGLAALRGDIHIESEAMARLTVPSNPLPDAPVVALRSDAGDYIGAGARYAYDHQSAVLTVTSVGNKLSVRVEGDEGWSGEFLLPGGGTVLEPGSYTGLSRYPFQAPGAGGLSWSGEARGCNTLRGELQIRSVRYEAGVLRAIDLGFEQFCEGGSTALRGDIRWDAATPVPVFEAPSPPPSAQWTSPAGTFPPTGDAMYLSSDEGDYIGAGYTWWVGAAVRDPLLPGTPPDSSGYVSVDMAGAGGLLRIGVEGLVRWRGEFQAPRGVQRLQPGYYGILQRYPFHNPARGGLSWVMDSRGCNQLKGWYVIDSISYDGEQIEAVELRFTQFCDNATAPLRGHIRWGSRGNTTRKAGSGASRQ